MKVLLTGIGMLLAASAAFGSGIDLTVAGCPGAGGIGEETGDPGCGTDPTIIVIATFAPAEAISDLVGLDGLVEMAVRPDLDAGNFWNVSAGGCGQGPLGEAFSGSNARPATGCDNHADTWGDGIGGVAALRRGPFHQRIAFGCARATPLAVNADQRLFGAQIIFNGNGDLEANGCVGCGSPVGMIWTDGKPASRSGTPTTQLIMPTGAFPHVTNCIGFNTGFTDCQAVPVARRTWGQLKSLYR